MRISDWSSDVCSSDLTIRSMMVELDETFPDSKVPLAVRAVMTTCAPFAASALAVAAPIPRLAPVTSATRPARGWSFIALLGLIQAFCEQCELIDLDRVVLIGERSRIVSVEAGFAMRGPEVRAAEARAGNRLGV